jgi:hypothetical protein
MLSTLTAILGSGAFIGLVGFFYSLGNRVTVLETQRDDLPAFLEARFGSINQRLDRIERALNGAMKGIE